MPSHGHLTNVQNTWQVCLKKQGYGDLLRYRLRDKRRFHFRWKATGLTFKMKCQRFLPPRCLILTALPPGAGGGWERCVFLFTGLKTSHFETCHDWDGISGFASREARRCGKSQTDSPRRCGLTTVKVPVLF